MFGFWIKQVVPIMSPVITLSTISGSVWLCYSHCL